MLRLLKQQIQHWAALSPSLTQSSSLHHESCHTASLPLPLLQRQSLPLLLHLPRRDQAAPVPLVAAEHCCNRPTAAAAAERLLLPTPPRGTCHQG
jgi:hypothetical protein